jgi:hypothetical protein
MLRAIALIFLLSGCVAMTWRHPERTEAQMQQDMRECEYEAIKATAAIINSFEAGWMKGDIQRKCMEVRGYRQQKL